MLLLGCSTLCPTADRSILDPSFPYHYHLRFDSLDPFWPIRRRFCILAPCSRPRRSYMVLYLGGYPVFKKLKKFFESQILCKSLSAGSQVTSLEIRAGTALRTRFSIPVGHLFQPIIWCVLFARTRSWQFRLLKFGFSLQILQEPRAMCTTGSG